AAGSAALGGSGGAKGYGGITPSLAIALNIYTGAGAPVGTSLGLNGVIGAPPIAVAPVAAAGGNPIRFDISYDATAQTITQVLTDTVANTTNTQTYTGVNLQTQLG